MNLLARIRARRLERLASLIEHEIASSMLGSDMTAVQLVHRLRSKASYERFPCLRRRHWPMTASTDTLDE
jgi:hypothetical protein